MILVSDSICNGLTDKSYDYLREALEKSYSHCKILYSTCKDDVVQIRNSILTFVSKSNLIITIGGTGLTIKDVTPEAILPLIGKRLTSMETLITESGLRNTVFASLSRPLCGTIDKTLVICFSGSCKAVKESFEAIKEVLPHALDLIKSEGSRHLHNTKQSTHICTNDKYNKENIPTRQSKHEMIEFDKALEIILNNVHKMPIQTLNLYEDCVIGNVVAENIHSNCNVPEFEASIVDGFALNSENQKEIMMLDKISSKADKLLSSLKLKNNAVMSINTGAPLPSNSDAVIMVEDTSLIIKDDITFIKLNKKVEKHENVRQIGSDIQKGNLIIKENTMLSNLECHLSIFASANIKQVKVHKAPIVGIVSTGDELIEAFSEKIELGQVIDVNRPSLINILNKCDFKTVDYGILKDNTQSIKELFSKIENEVDVLISTGSVSMGEMDLFKKYLEENQKIKIHFGRVKIKPGKPTTFSTFGKMPIFSLPGNPVSAIVMFYTLVLPAINKMKGVEKFYHEYISVKLDHQIVLDQRPEFHRTTITSKLNNSTGKFELVATTTGNQRSSRLLSMNNSNALLHLPPKREEKKVIEKGEFVKAIFIPSFL